MSTIILREFSLIAIPLLFMCLLMSLFMPGNSLLRRFIAIGSSFMCFASIIFFIETQIFLHLASSLVSLIVCYIYSREYRP